jgi:hypothetical protein
MPIGVVTHGLGLPITNKRGTRKEDSDRSSREAEPISIDMVARSANRLASGAMHLLAFMFHIAILTAIV